MSSSPPTCVTVSHKKIKPGHYRNYSTISPSLLSLPLCCFSSSPTNFEKKSQINSFLLLHVSLIPDLLILPHPALTVTTRTLRKVFFHIQLPFRGPVLRALHTLTQSFHWLCYRRYYYDLHYVVVALILN